LVLLDFGDVFSNYVNCYLSLRTKKGKPRVGHGERTTGIATLLGMVGMFMIFITYMRALMLEKSKKET